MTVISQEEIGRDIYSLWLQTDQMAQNARPGQFLSLYTGDGSKLLPRPISICEIDKEDSKIRLVYRVTGKNTGTEGFSRLKPGEKIEALGPLGNGFPLEEAEGKKVFLIGGGIGIPPMLETAKQLKAEKNSSVNKITFFDFMCVLLFCVTKNNLSIITNPIFIPVYSFINTFFQRIIRFKFKFFL